MVFVTSGPTIPQIRAGLLAAAAPTQAMAIHAQAFRAWLLEDTPRLDPLAVIAAAGLATGGVRSAGAVATLGYIDAAGRLSADFTAALTEGLAWLGDRMFRDNQGELPASIRMVIRLRLG
jgi:hypothetical protein